MVSPVPASPENPFLNLQPKQIRDAQHSQLAYKVCLFYTVNLPLLSELTSLLWIFSLWCLHTLSHLLDKEFLTALELFTVPEYFNKGFDSPDVDTELYTQCVDAVEAHYLEALRHFSLHFPQTHESLLFLSGVRMPPDCAKNPQRKERCQIAYNNALFPLVQALYLDSFELVLEKNQKHVSPDFIEGLRAILDSDALPPLTKLELGSPIHQDASLRSLCAFLSESPHLKSLHLDFNYRPDHLLFNATDRLFEVDPENVLDLLKNLLSNDDLEELSIEKHYFNNEKDLRNNPPYQKFWHDLLVFMTTSPQLKKVTCRGFVVEDPQAVSESLNLVGKQLIFL